MRFPVKLRAPRNFGNPGAFDYRGYLADNGIIVLGSSQAARIEVLPGFAGTRLAWALGSHRRHARGAEQFPAA